jgi:hypothetical protein
VIYERSLTASPRKPRPIIKDTAQSRSSDAAQFKIYCRGKCFMNFGASRIKNIELSIFCEVFTKSTENEDMKWQIPN